MHYFNPDLYDAKKWAKEAKAAGINYAVITTKHHEGFAMWDSALTSFKVTNSPIGRDLLAEFVDAFREEGIKIGFYYSLIDWHHPDFTLDGLHPLRDDMEAREKWKGDMASYRTFMHGQVKELLTNYGHIDYMWFDFSYPERFESWAPGKDKNDWASEELEELVLSLQPHILLNNRIDLDRGVVTPEQYQPQHAMTKDGEAVIWEACQTLTGSWGYHRDNLDWKTPDMLVKMLIDTVSKGGNLLLNVGPNGRGEFEAKASKTLADIGEWMRLHERSIVGAGESAIEAPEHCCVTQKGQVLYIHLFSWPMKHVHVKGLEGQVAYAQFLNDASEVHFMEHEPGKVRSHIHAEVTPGSVTFELPIQKPDVLVPVIEVFLKP
ncbi:alpha-L-fucosidase [Aureibacillus halotolerans]|uniref:alpha-L-fucosidase n=1 Tax=Aureibacillus halotolerans TaxID=1508390 RepID=A0A4V3D4Q2_9BACI|nr:alpha-L-fucosidase [Aureibacillus halotolerans]TDQ36787.1 alpha-L-fucosidase [Aureibacillus halotolerans]